jgi:peptidyl-prolyl cis-trans isomerase SurA
MQLAVALRPPDTIGILRDVPMRFARQQHRRRLRLARRAPVVLVALAGLAAPVSFAAQAQQAGLKPTVTDAARAEKKPAKAPAATKTAKASPGKRASSSTQSIVVLVNDEPITGYEIEQRMKFALLGAPDLQRRLQAKLKSPAINDQFKAFAIERLKANPPKSQEEQQARIKQLQGQFVQSIKRKVEAEYRPKAHKLALDELIEERIKMQEAKRLNVIAAKEDVDRVIKGMAERNKMTPEEFAQHIAKMGANISTMRQRIKATLSWSDVIRRRFGHQISTVGNDVEHIVTVPGQDDVELQLHRILLALPGNGGQTQVAQRLSEAERVRAQFGGCKTMSSLAAGISGARFDDLGDRKPATIPEPTRSLLLSAGDNEMLPPTIGEGGVELWALCGRKVVKTEEKQRQTAQEDSRQKEFEILSKKHLKDLRQDAHIEYR